MSDEETSYSVKIDEEMAGLDSAIGKLKEAEKQTEKTDESLRGLGDSMKDTEGKTSDAEEQIGALKKRLGELKAPGEIKRLTKEIEEFGKETKEKEGILQHFTHAALEPFLERAKQIAEFEFIRRGIDALIEAPAEIAEKLAELGKEIVLTAAKAERLDQSFKLTLGQEGAEEVLGWIERISNKTEFTDEQLKGWSSELLRAGVKVQDVDKFLAAGLDTAAKSTNKLEGMSAAISALSRAQLTGRVETRALRGLSIGVDELKTLPQFKGLSEKQLHKQMDEGKISKDDLLALIAGKDGVLGDLGLIAGKTFEAQLKNVKEIPEQIYQGLYKTAGFQELGDFLGRIEETFGSDSETGTHYAEVLADALDVVAGKLQSIDLDAVANDVSAALDQLPAAIETTKDLFDDLVIVLGVFGSAIDVLSKAIDYIPDAIGTIIPGFGPIFRGIAAKLSTPDKRDAAEVQYDKEQHQKLTDVLQARAHGEAYSDPSAAFGPQEDAVTRRRKRIEEIRAQQKEAGHAAGEGLTSGAQDSNPKLTAAGAGMGEAMKRGTNESLEIHSPSRALFRAGAFAGEGFVDGIESQNEEIENAMATAFAVPSTRGQGAAAAAGGGPVSVTVEIGGISITVAPGADGHDQAVAFTAALAQMLPGAIAGALERIGIQGGTT